MLEHLECTTLVRRVGRHGHLGACRNVGESLHLLGVEGHRLEMHGDEDVQVEAAGLDHFLQIRNRLEIVGVKFARIEREVRLDVVVEFHHLELDAFLLKRRLDEVDDVGVRHGRDADAKRRVGEGAAGNAGQGNGGHESDGCEKSGEIHLCSPDVDCGKSFLGLSDGDVVRPFRRNIRAVRAAEDAASGRRGFG